MIMMEPIGAIALRLVEAPIIELNAVQVKYSNIVLSEHCVLLKSSIKIAIVHTVV